MTRFPVAVSSGKPKQGLGRAEAAMEKADEPTALKKILVIMNESAPQYYEKAE